MTFPLRKLMSLVALLVVAGLFSVAFAPAASAASDPVHRLAGPDRIETAIAISRDLFPNGNAGAVVLATSQNFPDALAATPLATEKNAPILMTPTAGLDSRTAAEMTRILPKGRTVYVLGGTAALSQAVENQVRALGYVVDRLGGGTRFETALIIAQKFSDPQAIFLASGEDFRYALVAGPAAARTAGVVLLVTEGCNTRTGMCTPTKTAATEAYINQHPNVQRYAVGWAAARADSQVVVVGNEDYNEDAAQVALKFFPEAIQVGVTTNQLYPDALAAGPLAARHNMPLVFTGQNTPPRATEQYLFGNSGALNTAYVFGGTAAVSDGTKNYIGQLISG